MVEANNIIMGGIFSQDAQETVGVILQLFLLLVAIALVFARDLLTSIALSGFFGLLMAAMYLVLDAPDVAITEAAVGAGVATIIFLAAIIYTGRENKGPSCNLLTPLPVICIMGGALLYATVDMPLYGAPDTPVQQHVAPYYLTQTEKEIGIPNVVTAVLGSYRGFDTLGETIVVFTAALGVLLLLGLQGRGGQRKKEKS